jgi:subtilisin family serine protease
MTHMMKRTSSLLPLISILLLASCGNIFKKSGAPIQGTEGLLTCATESQALAVAQKFGGQYRILNKTAKLVEIYGVSKEDLKKELPGVGVKQNKVFNETIMIKNQNMNMEQVNIKSITPSRNNTHEYYFNHLNQIGGFYLDENQQGQNITIAVVDSGVYYNHEHLLPNLKVKASESSQNGVDSDGNGYIDDYKGWDFYNDDNDPEDDNGHGTHVAGLAAGVLSGVAPKAKILPIKVLSSTGSGDIGTVAAGILYAIQNGADVINLSLGGSTGATITDEVRQLISNINVGEQNGVILVAAAGNGGGDGQGDSNDLCPVLPANIDSQSVISVAAVDGMNNLTMYSNFGRETVDIAAPGGSGWYGLFSTYIPNCTQYCNELTNYASLSGTSMATPLVTGLVALIKSMNPSLSISQIRSKIFNNGQSHDQLDGKIITGKVINVADTLNTIL